jgi:ubiquinone biosynthesis protein
MNLTSIPQYVSDAKRFREIIATLVKYGLAGWISDTHPEFIKGLLTGAGGQRLSGLSQPVRIRMALTELGPTFIKLGQMLSTRADLVGHELADELSQLQSGTPADPPETVSATIIEDLGKPPEELFAEFELDAMASASIGQVHRASLPDGQHVVVKVQHEGIQDRVTNDLQILMALAHLAETHAPQLRSYQPVATAAEFRRILLRELDFTRELRNLEQFTENFRQDDSVHIPQAFRELSSRRVLTMEMLEGVSVSHAAELKSSGADLNEFARRGANMFLDMIFRDGFYHADPHPGNLMLLGDGVIGVLDCGMAGRIDDELRHEIEDLLLAAVKQDGREMTDIIVRLGSVPPDLDRGVLQAEIGEFLADYTGQSLQDFDMSGALNGITDIIRRFHIILPSSCSMLLKVLVMLEGTSRQLDPQFCLAELIEPYYVKAMQRRFSPKKLMQRAQRTIRDWDRLLNMLPRELSDILDRIKRGTFDVHLEHRRLDTTINRLVLGILTAALFMGSAQLWSRAAPPVVGGISVFGAIGYAVATLLGIRLLLAIKGSGDIKPDRRGKR